MMSASPPPSPSLNPVALWFQVGGAIFSGMGCLSLMGAVLVIGAINLFTPPDTLPAGYDKSGQDAYSVATAPFRALRWIFNEVSPVLIGVGLAPLLLGILFLLVGRGIAQHRPWSRIAGAALLLVPVLFGIMAILGAVIDRDYDVAIYTPPLVLLPLYPFWLVVWKWPAGPPEKVP
jgi:hypothetical protein